MKRIYLIVLFQAALAACSSSNNGNGNGSNPPAVNSFAAIPATIQTGATTALTWDVSNADSISIDQGVGAVTGTAVAVHPTANTTYTLTATNKKGSTTKTASVTVTAAPGAPQAGFSVTTSAATVTAGTAVTLTITAIDASGATVTGYTGTVHVTSTDAQAALPGDVTFAAGDSGVKTASFTPKTAGTVGVSVADSAKAALAGSANVSVGAAAASVLHASGVAANIAAGSAISLVVTASDAYGNRATGYAGDVKVDSDGSVVAEHTFVAGDGGSYAFGFSLTQAGAAHIKASDGTLSTAVQSLTVAPGPAAQFVFTGSAQDVIAGTPYPSLFSATPVDAYGNATTSASATVTSSDSGATLAAADFSGGAASLGGQFVTLGVQTITVTDSSTGATATSPAVVVHGLVYTPPAEGTQSVAVVLDGSSTAAVTVLKVVAEAGATGYSAGFNIPADSSKAAVVDIAPGTALDPGSAPAAIAAALPGAGPLANHLTAGISQKAGGTGAVASDASIAAGQVLYTVRLKPTSTSPGVVFDGSSAFRAAVRNLAGDEVLSQADFAIGKLELQ